MLQQFINHVKQQHLFPTGQQVLLAVSGGVDSSVLAHLMHAAGFPFAIAHCNFHLRPGDCDRDELFVRQLAQCYGVPVFVAQFDTRSYANAHGQSIEEAARQLRYNYFEQLLQSEGFAAILTAHHRDDAAETFFINLLRGTGIHGLHGILPVNGHVVRPLLPFGREDIELYAKEHGVSYVVDVTNASLDYRRNQVRHLLMPLLRQIQPSADEAIRQTIANIQSVEGLYDDLLAPLREQYAHRQPDGTIVIRTEGVGFQLLYELLHPFGFNAATIQSVATATQSGRKFFSPTHQAVYDRGSLIVAPVVATDAVPATLCSRTFPMPVPFAEYVHTLRSLPPMTAVFDADKVVQPIALRHWQSSDRFQPLGMKTGSQLVSDYFSDHKYNLFEKQRQLLLVDACGDILWIVGHRTSHPHRVTPQTITLLEIQVQKCSNSPDL